MPRHLGLRPLVAAGLFCAVVTPGCGDGTRNVFTLPPHGPWDGGWYTSENTEYDDCTIAVHYHVGFCPDIALIGTSGSSMVVKHLRGDVQVDWIETGTVDEGVVQLVGEQQYSISTTCMIALHTETTATWTDDQIVGEAVTAVTLSGDCGTVTACTHTAAISWWKCQPTGCGACTLL